MLRNEQLLFIQLTCYCQGCGLGLAHVGDKKESQKLHDCMVPMEYTYSWSFSVALVCMFAALNSQVHFLNVDNKMSDLEDQKRNGFGLFENTVLVFP